MLSPQCAEIEYHNMNYFYPYLVVSQVPLFSSRFSFLTGTVRWWSYVRTFFVEKCVRSTISRNTQD